MLKGNKICNISWEPFVQWCVIVTSMKVNTIDDKKISLNLNLKH
jgi:hypothetical protein